MSDLKPKRMKKKEKKKRKEIRKYRKIEYGELIYYDKGAHYDRIIFIHSFYIVYVVSEKGSKVSRNM